MVYVAPAPGANLAALYIGGVENVRLYNNIFIAAGGARLIEATRPSQRMTIAGNCFWTADCPVAIDARAQGPGETKPIRYDQFAAWEHASGTGPNLWADPLASAGKGPAGRILREDSPCRDHGADLGGMKIDPGSVDYFGQRIRGDDQFIGIAHPNARPATRPSGGTSG